MRELYAGGQICASAFSVNVSPLMMKSIGFNAAALLTENVNHETSNEDTCSVHRLTVLE